MAQLYFRRIRDLKMTIEDVPMRWREETQLIIDEHNIKD